MKKIALLMASAAVAAVISGCTAMQYAPDELKWTTKHSDDEIYGKDQTESNSYCLGISPVPFQCEQETGRYTRYRSDKGRPAAPLGAGGQQHDRGCC